MAEIPKDRFQTESMLVFAFISSLAICMAAIPLLTWWAPRLGLIDVPDVRKVHAHAIPRVGGIAMVAGAIASLVLWAHIDSWVQAYLFGSVVLLAFGVWDDSQEMGHYVKFVGQGIAAVAIVYFGDLWVAKLPFLDGEIPALLGKPFTVFALIGMVNAINHSDGLDGLAGGECLLSLTGMGFIAHGASNPALIIIVAAIAGSVFGFLRFNSHPARIFMGDSGSQFLGLTLGVLAVYVTQRLDTSMSMATPALLLGLPIADILSVFLQRVRSRMNWFRATRNHVHHRLLDLGFAHYQAVVIIYALQAVLVASGIVFRYESDTFVAALYLGACMALFGLLTFAERSGWRIVPASPRGAARALSPNVVEWVRRAALSIVSWGVPLYLVVRSAFAGSIPSDFSTVAGVLVGICAASLFVTSGNLPTSIARLAIYSGATTVIALLERNGSFSTFAPSLDAAYFVVLAFATGTVMRLDSSAEFRSTPLDFLLIFLVVVAGVLAEGALAGFQVSSIVMRIAVLFYACEVLLGHSSGIGVRRLQWSVMCACSVIVLTPLFKG